MEFVVHGGSLGLRHLICGLGLCALLLSHAGAQASAPMLATPLPAAQTLAPGDLVAVSVFQAPELATTARLDASGAVAMPEAGRIQLAGLSTAQAEAAIAARLTKYLLSPQVQILVREYAPAPVTVLGAVRNPGTYSARSYPTLAAVLAAAGGVTTSAGGQVIVSDEGGQAARTLDLGRLERTADAPAVPLSGGDVVRVIPAATVYVGGDVAKPGAYPMPSTGLTLVEAISLAGGLTHEADASHTRLVHTTATGQLSTDWVNARLILQGQASDPALRPLDLVYVPYSPQRATANRLLSAAVGLGTTIVGGLVVFH